MSVFSEMSLQEEENVEDGLSCEADTFVNPPTEDDGDVDDSMLELAQPMDTESFDPFGENVNAEQAKNAGSEQLSYTQKKQNHEEQEAIRKAEWEVERQDKCAQEQAAWENNMMLSDDELLAASVNRIASEAERLTRRNMKDSVAKHIQDKCASDIAFAKQALHPRKSMVNCFRYINRLALAYMKEEMTDNGEEILRDAIGGDVPDDICYKWAEEYFCDMDAAEDSTQDEQFVPKTFFGAGTSAAKKTCPKPQKKEPPKKAEFPKQPNPLDDGQISFWGGIAG